MFELVYSPHQWTPLHYAALRGYADTVQYLIKAGANLNIKDDFRVSEKDNSTDCTLLYSHCSTNCSCIHTLHR